MPEQGEKLVKTSVVAKELGVSVNTVHRWVVDKGLPAFQPDRDMLFYLSEVHTWLEKQRYESNNTVGRSGNTT